MWCRNIIDTIPITCSRVLNSSPGRLDLGGLGFKSPGSGAAAPTSLCADTVPHLIGGGAAKARYYLTV